jgi:AmmeMemoRadiSam system protein B
MSLGIRKPFVAGQFYEAEPGALSSMINQITQEEMGTECISDGVRAVILPHAGYMFSARTAIKTLLKIGERDFKKILLIAPSHRYPFNGIAAAKFDTYSTPLGDIPVDTEAMDMLIDQECEYIHNLPQAQQYEHALEVELPLLQHFFSDFTIIPLIAGFVDTISARKIAAALEQWWREDILWVISSDFTHYGQSFNYCPFKGDVKENLRKLDLGAVDFIVKHDLDGFNHYVNRTGATICGAAPIKILLAELLQSIEKGTEYIGDLADYTTSGDLTGDFSHCVSYAGITFRDKD